MFYCCRKRTCPPKGRDIRFVAESGRLSFVVGSEDVCFVVESEDVCFVAENEDAFRQRFSVIP